MKADSRALGPFVLPAAALLMLIAAELRPGYFNNVSYLAGLLLLEIVAVAVWHYDKWYFLATMLVFLWAGSDVPLSGASPARWVFLGAGALVGLIKWARSERRNRLGGLHLVALLCVMMAVVSSIVSNRMQLSLLKSSSLFLLFLYGSCGIRITLVGREARFFRGLLMACEVITYLSALSYVGVHFEVFGNPNSLGAIMGIVVVPVLLWGVLTTEDRRVQHRRTVALCLAVYLLMSSISRAAFLGSAIAVAVMCVAMHRQRILVKSAFMLVLLTTMIAIVQPSHFEEMVSAVWDDVIYKGRPQEGLLGSRKSPWQETAEVIKESPWFGSGFGSDEVRNPEPNAGSLFRTVGGSAREHGNSYLALLQYVGLLGVVPFTVLLLIVSRLIYRVCVRTWRAPNSNHYAILLATVCLAALVHAFFEDWLFAVGYYLTVFFWCSVFILSDLQSSAIAAEPNFVRAWDRRPLPVTNLQLSTNR